MHRNRAWTSRSGVLFTGSSDTTICVWKIWTVPRRMPRRRPAAWTPGKSWAELSNDFWGGEEVDDHEVRAEVTDVLRGHGGGVLDLRVDENWIVSW